MVKNTEEEILFHGSSPFGKFRTEGKCLFSGFKILMLFNSGFFIPPQRLTPDYKVSRLHGSLMKRT